jgi:transcriptional regulator with XRE-family HTH domain
LSIGGDLVELGERIKQALALKNMSQVELAAKLDIPVSTLSGYILGRYIPDSIKIKNIACAIGVSTDFLFGVYLNDALTNDELSLIARYRKFSEKQRDSALDYLKYLGTQGLELKCK